MGRKSKLLVKYAQLQAHRNRALPVHFKFFEEESKGKDFLVVFVSKYGEVGAERRTERVVVAVECPCTLQGVPGPVARGVVGRVVDAKMSGE